MNGRTWKALIATTLLASPCTTGCNQQEAPPTLPPPEVAVVTVQPQKVLLTSDLPGRTAVYRIAEIRPQVNGLLKRRVFEEGSEVKKDDLLYEIDPAPYRAACHIAEANLAVAKETADRAQATLGASKAGLARHRAIVELTQTNLDRYEKLVPSQAASLMQRDQAAADLKVALSGLEVAKAQVESDEEAVNVAKAAIKQAEAALETAQINLDYTRITAPFNGRIGRSLVTEGAILTAYQPQELATIQQLDPIFVDVKQSITELNRLRRSLANGRLKNNGTDRVRIILDDGTEYSREGSLKFRDVTVDPTTGSVVLRVVVPNPEGILLPGMFVRAIVDEGVNEQALLVPQQAVSRDPKGNPWTFVVNGKNEAEQRALVTDRAMGDRWLVTEGVSPGDRVIVEGILQVQQRQRMLKSEDARVVVKPVPFDAGRRPPAKPAGAAPTATPSK